MGFWFIGRFGHFPLLQPAGAKFSVNDQMDVSSQQQELYQTVKQACF